MTKQRMFVCIFPNSEGYLDMCVPAGGLHVSDTPLEALAKAALETRNVPVVAEVQRDGPNDPWAFSRFVISDNPVMSGEVSVQSQDRQVSFTFFRGNLVQASQAPAPSAGHGFGWSRNLLCAALLVSVIVAARLHVVPK